MFALAPFYIMVLSMLLRSIYLLYGMEENGVKGIDNAMYVFLCKRIFNVT